MRLGSIGERIQICIPSVGLIRGRVAYFPTDPREVARIFHQINQMRPAGILYLIKTFHFIVMGVEARKHDVAEAGHQSIAKEQRTHSVLIRQVIGLPLDGNDYRETQAAYEGDDNNEQDLVLEFRAKHGQLFSILGDA